MNDGKNTSGYTCINCGAPIKCKILTPKELKIDPISFFLKCKKCEFTTNICIDVINVEFGEYKGLLPC